MKSSESLVNVQLYFREIKYCASKWRKKRINNAYDVTIIISEIVSVSSTFLY